MSRKPTAADVVFVIDASASTSLIFDALIDLVHDQAVDIQHANQALVRDRRLRFGAVTYRDPLDDHHRIRGYTVSLAPGGSDDPPDRHDMCVLGDGIETMQEFLGTIKPYGGWDDPEDWVGALDLALNYIGWGDGKKCIFWIADANAHGSRFSNEPHDRHNDQIEPLVHLVRKMAEKQIYFIGINVRKGEDPGCEKTFRELKTIYDTAGGPSWVTAEFRPVWNRNCYDGDGWPPDVMSSFQQALC
jgi:hypothetical protein